MLWPAIEGFAPTTEMPEIAEAQEMIAAIEAGPRLWTGVDNALSNGRRGGQPSPDRSDRTDS